MLRTVNRSPSSGPRHRVDPDRKLMLSNERAIRVEHFTANPGVMHGRDAQPRTRQRRAPQLFADLLLAGRWNLSRH